MPAIAAPVASPVKPASDIGVSYTRLAPNSWNKPFVSPRTLLRTSSPRTNTASSRSISSRNPSRIASRSRISRIVASLLSPAPRGKPGIGHGVHSLQRVLRSGELALARIGDRFLQLRLLLLVHPGRIAQFLVAQPERIGCDRITQAPFGDLLLGAVLEPQRALGREVTDEAVRQTLEKGGPPAPPGPRHQGRGRPMHGPHVHPVDRFGRHAVGGGPVRKLLNPRHVADGGGNSVAVVLADEYDRKLPDAREVHGFMHHALVDRSIAEERNRHPAAVALLERHRGAAGYRHAGPDDAVGAVYSEAEVRDVHRTAATAVVAGLPAHQFGHHAPGVAPLGQNDGQEDRLQRR